jgi:hypothetical protein
MPSVAPNPYQTLPGMNPNSQGNQLFSGYNNDSEGTSAPTPPIAPTGYEGIAAGSSNPVVKNIYGAYGSIFNSVLPGLGGNPGASQSYINQNTLSPTNLLPGQRTLDDQTQNLITNQLNQFQSPQDMTNQLTRGMQSTAQSFLPTAGPGSNVSLGAMGGPMTSALINNGSQMFQNQLNALQRNVAINSPLALSNYQSQAGANLGAYEQLKLKNYQQQAQYMLQAQQQQYQYQQALNQGAKGAIGSAIGGLGAIAALI